MTESSQVAPSRLGALSSRVSPSGREVGYEMSNGDVAVLWTPGTRGWHISAIRTSAGALGFRDFDLWQLNSKSSGLTEMLFPLLAVPRLNENDTRDEKLFMPLLGGAIKKSPSTGLGLFGSVDAADLEAAGIRSVNGISLVELANPGAASMQWSALYSYEQGRGLFIHTDDLSGVRKDFGYGSGHEFTLLSTRGYTTGPVAAGEGDTFLSPGAGVWDVAFEQISGSTWTVTYTQPERLKAEDGFDLMLEQPVSGGSDPDFVELEGPVSQIVVTVVLSGDTVILSLEAAYRGRTYSVPYRTRMTHMAGRLYDFAQRYRTWALASRARWLVPNNDPDYWWFDRRTAEDTRLHVGLGCTGLDASYTGFLAAMQKFADLFLGGDASALSTYWQDWHSEEGPNAVEGAYWPDWSPTRPGLKAALDQAAAAGFHVGLYTLPTVYDRNSQGYAADDVAGSLAMLDADGEIVTNAGGIFSLRDRLNMKVSLETMLERWRHAWIDHGPRGLYHDAVSGLPEDSYPDRRPTLAEVGGTTIAHEGVREWLMAVMRDQARPGDNLLAEDATTLLMEDETPIEVEYPAQPAVMLAEDDSELQMEDGSPIHLNDAATLTLDDESGVALDTEADADILLDQGHYGVEGVMCRIENPQEHLLDVAQVQAQKFNFIAALGFLPVDKAWHWVYGERAMTVNITDNPILRPSSVSPDPFTAASARLFVIGHVGQFHAGMLVGLSAFSAAGAFFAAVPDEVDWGAGETILYGKIRQLTTLDGHGEFRAARQRGRLLRPPAGFFWDRYEAEASVADQPLLVDLFKHPTLDRVALVISNLRTVPQQVTLSLSVTDYPDLVGMTEGYDVSSGVESLAFSFTNGVNTPLTIPAETTKGYILR